MGGGKGFFSSLLGRSSSGKAHEWTGRELSRLTPTEFEQVVGSLYTADGYDVELAGPTAEGGVDLLARNPGFLRSKLLVIAVIPPGGTASSATVRQLARAREMNGATLGVLVRPARFERNVQAVADDSGSIELVGAEKLASRLTRLGVLPP